MALAPLAPPPGAAASASAAHAARALSHLACSTSSPSASLFRPRGAPPAHLYAARRRQHSAALCAAGGGNAGGTAAGRELLAIRGVGPVNATLLAAHDIRSVARLQQMFHLVFNKDASELERFLTVRPLSDSQQLESRAR
jgi:predicted flap endonuclease-1-like 5' DNA nuclease